MISVDEFNSIYRQHVDAAFRVSLRAVSRREIAEEITSEVFLTLFQSADTMTREQLPAWLFTVAKRRSADYWQRWYLEQCWADSTVESEARSQSFSHSEIPFTDLLARCTALKPVHRASLVLCFVQGMTRKEIASQTGLSELQVKGHLQYALKLLRDTMTVYRQDVPPPRNFPQMPELEDRDQLPAGVRIQAECPPVALIRAWPEGALPDELVRDVAAHMSDCALCRTLLADLDQILQPAITSAERERIRRRLTVVVFPAERHTGWHWYAAISAVAALVIAGVFLTVRLAEHPHVAQNEMPVASPPNQAATAPQVPAQVDALSVAGIHISKLAPPLDLSPGLILRGETSAIEPTAPQLAPAFRAYNSGDYALATQLFSQLAKQFPRSGRPFLYLGVTQLLTNDNADALFNLKRAEQFVSPSEKDATSWYHLAASARTQASDTGQLAHTLCNRNHSTYAEHACQLEKSLLPNKD